MVDPLQEAAITDRLFWFPLWPTEVVPLTLSQKLGDLPNIILFSFGRRTRQAIFQQWNNLKGGFCSLRH